MLAALLVSCWKRSEPGPHNERMWGSGGGEHIYIYVYIHIFVYAYIYRDMCKHFCISHTLALPVYSVVLNKLK